MATICAVTIATVLMTVVAAILLSPGEGAGLSLPKTSPAGPVEAVAGYAGVPVLRISGTTNPIDLAKCRVYLTDPDGIFRTVETAVLENTNLSDGQAAYVFYLPTDERTASGYWITDVPDLVFTDTHHPGVRPFTPGGDWRVVVYDPDLMKTRIDRVVPVTEPSSPE
ncbi:hypothetical protein HL657_06490 [Methanoculleus sp. YWC-01]|jgi:hypothetical protein|uniref:Uncharacterized protein n=1 Tax=Methanoculleus nereidis TaxID=2735141 RepID=A0ABU3Z221_9EURY|nr:hypothetical protein [Methanoculleus sp. YWC-01]MDV4342826.1 hypothetical protein [Methanoculleus sp. YWC-01]PKL54860.1 MAG: hypothetical protein CVV35_13090 [Methanomicrobiales archaeon HGW-Methanomicrobiales-6]